MHRLLERQLAKTARNNSLDKACLFELISEAYEDYDSDRERTDRAMTLMTEENERHNTELQATVKKLAVQNSSFAEAFKTMSHGLCMFDHNNRLVLANPRFVELFQLPQELAHAGAPIGPLLLHATRNGILARSEWKELWRDASTAPPDSGPVGRDLELGDGRIIESTLGRTGRDGWVVVCEDVTEQRRAQARMRHMARHDALTDLANRTQFNEAMEWHLCRTDRGEQIAIMCLDLDRFKAVNDMLGHPIGDKLLIAVAERLRSCVRHGDVVARMGGDEFAITQVGAPQPAGATGLGHRIIDVLGAPYEIDGNQVSIGVSIGVAVAPFDGDNAVQLLKNADLALYRAKEDGRGVMRFYEPVMDADMLARRALESELRQALIQGDFELFYQPLIDLSTNEISGLEALIRWNHTERGLVAPSDFVPFAEEIGLIVPIGDWVLTRACLDAASWSVPVSVAVNLSPAQFKNGHLTASVIEALDTAGLKPSRLELEITESVLLQNTEHTIEVLRELRELGVRISMDDFGTGYSPLSYIRRFPFDKIKIDQAFVSDLDNDADAIAIIRAIADLGGSLGIRTTGEGVETEEQLRTLRRQGCTEVQGYLFSPPRPAADIEELLIGLSKTSARSIARSTVS